MDTIILIFSLDQKLFFFLLLLFKHFNRTIILLFLNIIFKH